MPTRKSEEYYFPYGDLVIQVEDTLFKLYRGLLELHSGFFRDMLSTPSSDDQEGTSDERPLRLPQELCSADSFTTLCQMICPKVMGVFPPVRAKDFVQWERVLEATETLQMAGVQSYIVAQLQGNEADIKDDPVRLLIWAIRSELPLDDLKRECFCALAYRRRPLSAAEADALGGETTTRVTRLREKIRLFILNPTSAELLKSHFPTVPDCSSKAYCKGTIFDQFIYNLTNEDDPASDSELGQDNSDIFRVLHTDHPIMSPTNRCHVKPVLDQIGPLLRKAVLDDKVRRYMRRVSPPAEES